MTEEVQLVFDVLKESLKKSFDHLVDALSKIRTGKATPAMFNSVYAEYYGSKTQLSQMASINNMDAKTIVIKPFDKSALEAIEKGIFSANLGVTPQNDGETILISIPPLTEERRKEYVKKAKAEGEETKVGIRNARRDALDEIKKLEKDDITEDLAKQASEKADEMAKSYGAKVDKLIKAKEDEIMTI